MNDQVKRSDAEWRAALSDEQYRVTRKGATERPFSGRYVDCKSEGVYQCVCCGAELFFSETKYDSGSGWPSFTEPAERGAVATRRDTSHGMIRDEVLCARRRHDIARHHRQVVVDRAYGLERLDHLLLMAVCGIDNDHVHAGLEKGSSLGGHVPVDSYRSCNQ